METEIRAEITSLIQQVFELEYRYSEATIPRGVLGLNAAMFKEYLRFIAYRRCQHNGLYGLYFEAKKSISAYV